MGALYDTVCESVSFCSQNAVTLSYGAVQIHVHIVMNAIQLRRVVFDQVHNML